MFDRGLNTPLLFLKIHKRKDKFKGNDKGFYLRVFGKHCQFAEMSNCQVLFKDY